jgi:hypothetical protein
MFWLTFEISHAEDNADPQNARLPALRCTDWFGVFSSELGPKKDREDVAGARRNTQQTNDYPWTGNERREPSNRTNLQSVVDHCRC